MNTTEILTDAMRRMQAGEKLTYTDKEVELIMLGWHAELQKAVAAEREACAKACESSANGFGEETPWAAGYVQGILDVASGIRARGTP